MTLFEALEIINGFSKPSKMPCNSWSIPAKDCKTGAKLVQVSGSVCNDCYALSGFYRMGNVKSCLEKRLQSLSDPKWEEAMTVAISGSEGSGYFRWFDSGDIQSLAHLKQIYSTNGRSTVGIVCFTHYGQRRFWYRPVRNRPA